MSQVIASTDFYDDMERNQASREAIKEADAMPNHPLITWRDAVAVVTQRLLDESTGLERDRVELAKDLAIDASVFISPAQTMVMSDGHRYVITDDTCACPDYAHAPMKACKHRIAVRIHKRAEQLLRMFSGQDETSAMAEAPVSVNFHRNHQGRSYQVTLRSARIEDVDKLIVMAEALMGKPAPERRAEPERGAEPEWGEPDDIPYDSAPNRPEWATADMPFDDDYGDDDEAETPMCRVHGTPMRASAKKGIEWFCSKRNADDSYCDYVIRSKRPPAKNKTRR